ncbi:hypothetical protein THAOC_35363 [Thalassiosira oceanica]|uniref:RNA helicase n=1 Tax=Thalassiosira oceanica TaxID=159749 RepID=K0RH96_THAOC|nr:hypothetical protein THAOC_35363 [Thalassiosira oceanica]|eukprot:EJK45997.1 hypothetical protein THAOC_35363 [Thalassiosira oceanica]
MNSSTEKSISFPKAIVIAPGRELASQIFSVAQSLLQNTGLTVSMAIGGTPFSRNVEKLRKRKPDIVVGTPGRIAELIIGRPGDKGGKMKISGLKTVVMDEFDALLQYDAHKEPTMAILQALDRQHGDALQRVLCSATAVDMMGSDSKIEQYMRKGYAHASIDENDVLVTSGVETKSKNGSTSTSARVSRTTIHGALHVPHRRLALEAVRKVLNTDPFPQQALIFVDSPRRVDIVIEKLAQMDIIAAPLHGGQGSGKGDRAEVNKALREGFVGIVVATEMAARGIDAPYLSHVINLDLPTDASHYAHRAGRCGRGGRPGVAVSITSDKRERNVPRKFAEELGITMYNVEAREGLLNWRTLDNGHNLDDGWNLQFFFLLKKDGLGKKTHSILEAVSLPLTRPSTPIASSTESEQTNCVFVTVFITIHKGLSDQEFQCPFFQEGALVKFKASINYASK